MLALPEPIRQALAAFVTGVRAKFGPAIVEIRLFGSRARDTARPDSDVDVLVVVDGRTQAMWRAIVDLAADLGVEYDVNLAPLILDRSVFATWLEQERPLACDIARQGIAL